MLPSALLVMRDKRDFTGSDGRGFVSLGDGIVTRVGLRHVKNEMHVN